jgi:hypothetical protein
MFLQKGNKILFFKDRIVNFPVLVISTSGFQKIAYFRVGSETEVKKHDISKVEGALQVL